MKIYVTDKNSMKEKKAKCFIIFIFIVMDVCKVAHTTWMFADDSNEPCNIQEEKMSFYDLK
jgi:hypothetical protein